MSSALSARADLDAFSLSDADVAELVEIATCVVSQVEELRVRAVSEADERNLARDAGCASTTAWLAQSARLSRVEASRIVKLSRAMSPEVEPTRRVWAAGQVSSAAAAVICEAIDRLPAYCDAEVRDEAQARLLEYAATFATDDLRRLANRIIEVIDPDGAEQVLGAQLEAEAKKAWDATRLFFSPAGEGTTTIRGKLPTLHADMLRTRLEAIAAPRRAHLRDAEGEASLEHGQRMGRALCELIEHLPAESLPQAGGSPAVVTVAIDEAALRTRLATATLSTGATISASEARRLACNAGLLPMVLGADSKILDMAPAQRYHDRYQRIALAKRDGGCCWPGCDRPPGWCEAHHLDFYADGGPTIVDNGALFCFTHHHLLHEGTGWEARLAPDHVVEVIPPERVDPHRRPRRHTRHTRLRPRAA